mmetsp:Transcript_3732/g.11814  ORF Transcript_3732/g.11814 Transcript_3732/m.11814 type:complete len:242 (-) Transcript_3732:105-830(-)
MAAANACTANTDKHSCACAASTTSALVSACWRLSLNEASSPWSVNERSTGAMRSSGPKATGCGENRTSSTARCERHGASVAMRGPLNNPSSSSQRFSSRTALLRAAAATSNSRDSSGPGPSPPTQSSVTRGKRGAAASSSPHLMNAPGSASISNFGNTHAVAGDAGGGFESSDRIITGQLTIRQSTVSRRTVAERKPRVGGGNGACSFMLRKQRSSSAGSPETTARRTLHGDAEAATAGPR